MICPSCTHEIQPYEDLGPDMRIQSRCPRGECNSIIRGDAPQTPPVVAREPSKAVAANASTRPTRKPRNVTAPRSTIEIVKARLAAVERKLATMRSLESEAAQLRAMVAAAEPTKPINGRSTAITWEA